MTGRASLGASRHAGFVAVVPKERPSREKAGREEAAGLIRDWFGDADVTEPVTSDVEPLTDRIRITFRIHEHEPDGWYLVEQVAYATVGEDRFVDMNLACSGFRPATDWGREAAGPRPREAAARGQDYDAPDEVADLGDPEPGPGARDRSVCITRPSSHAHGS